MDAHVVEQALFVFALLLTAQQDQILQQLISSKHNYHINVDKYKTETDRQTYRQTGKPFDRNVIKLSTVAWVFSKTIPYMVLNNWRNH